MSFKTHWLYQINIGWVSDILVKYWFTQISALVIFQRYSITNTIAYRYILETNIIDKTG